MINAFYSAASGLTSFQNKVNVSANNMANVNTPGFKSQIASFTDLNYTKVYDLKDQEKEITVGNGVRLNDTSSVLSQGNLEQTGRTLDVAIQGEGYFKIKDENGKEFYTRSGNFQIQNRDGTKYLVTSSGDSVLDDNGQPIEIAASSSNIVFRADNSEIENLSGEDEENTNAKTYVKIGVYTFDNPYALIRDGFGRLSESQASGEGKIFYESKTNQGSLERSNVDLAGEMTNLLMAQRGFSLNSKVLQTADELENIANNLR